MSFDGPDSTPSDSTDISVPVDITDQPLKWDGNDARILGLLKETWEHLERNGHLVTHIQKRARVLSNGKLAVDHISSVPFLMGLEDEPERTLTSMCPPAPLRIASVNAWRAFDRSDDQ